MWKGYRTKGLSCPKKIGSIGRPCLFLPNCCYRRVHWCQKRAVAFNTGLRAFGLFTLGMDRPRIEQEGLEAVAKDPSQPHVGLLKAGHRLIFRAVYADKAVSKACVSCHNSHPSSPRKDFKLNDVMGGII